MTQRSPGAWRTYVLALLLTMAAHQPARGVRVDDPPSGDFAVAKVMVWPPNPNVAWTPPDWAWLGRILRAQPEALVFDNSTCIATHWRFEPVDWEGLFAQSFPADTGFVTNAPPARPVDMGVTIAHTTTALVWRADCSGGRLSTEPTGAAWLRPTAGVWRDRTGEYSPGSDNWWARTPNGQWLMRDGDRLLFLKPLDMRKAPRPSFSCSKQPLDVIRRAVCADHDLAGWERSAALSWQFAFKRHRNVLPYMQDEYKSWAAELENCKHEVRRSLKDCLIAQYHIVVFAEGGS